MNQLDRDRVFHAMRVIGCVACIRRGYFGVPPDAHHLTTGGMAGQKRLGDDIVAPLCPYHHRNVIPSGKTSEWMRDYFGPSLAAEPKAFRDEFGDQEELRAQFLRLFERHEANVVGRCA